MTQYPDIARGDVDVVLVAESPEPPPDLLSWPDGLISVSTFESTDGETTLTCTQWSEGTADHRFMAEFTGADPVEYQLYRSIEREDPPVPGCVVVVRIEFDGPDPGRQRQWVDTVLAAMAGEPEPIPGGISGHFHVSTDGTRVLNYAEWTDEQAHRTALERSGQGTVGSAPGWQRVWEFPGVRDSEFRRYRLLHTRTVSEEDVVDSPTDWVAEHIRRYVETDGESGHLYQGWPTLLLTTRGRKSGKLRRTALIYGQDGDRYLLVGSNAASAQHPAWYLNLAAHPEVTVQVRSEKFTGRARRATGEERRELWPRMASIFPLYDTYQARSDRELPLVVIERSVPS